MVLLDLLRSFDILANESPLLSLRYFTMDSNELILDVAKIPKGSESSRCRRMSESERLCCSLALAIKELRVFICSSLDSEVNLERNTSLGPGSGFTVSIPLRDYSYKMRNSI